MLLSIKSDNNYKSLPPNNILAEEIIIGYLLLDNIIKEYILKNINLNFFTLQKHQILYFYIIHAKNDVSNNNITGLINQLWAKNLLKRIGGLTSIVKIIKKSQGFIYSCYRYNYADYCIVILNYHYTKRLFIQYSYNILQLSYLSDISTDNISNKAQKYLTTISKNKDVREQAYSHHTINYFLSEVDKCNTNNVNTTSGFHDLDRITNGFKQGELIIIAGRPSMGKTSFAINIAHHTAFELQLKVKIFSLEMSKDEILDKLLALMSNITTYNIQQKTIKAMHWRTLQKACKLIISSSLYIDDESNSSVDYIKSQCNSHTNKKKL